jgi:hypothetical protein
MKPKQPNNVFLLAHDLGGGDLHSRPNVASIKPQDQYPSAVGNRALKANNFDTTQHEKS